MKKSSFLIIIFLFFVACTKKNEDIIVVATPFGPLAYPLMIMAENQIKNNSSEKIELKIWNNPDQLRAIVAGNQADIISVPANVAVNLSNKGVDIKLLGISLWSVMWIVSGDSTKKTVNDFYDEDIIMGFKGDMPNILFNIISSKNNLNPEKDFRLHFTATPMDAMNQLLIGNFKNAVLSEPEISYLMSESRKKNKRFYRAVDLQMEWRKFFGSERGIPFGGIAVLEPKKKKRKNIDKFIEEYKKAVRQCNENPSVISAPIKKYFKGLKHEPNVEAMKHIKLEYISANECRKELETFFKTIYDFNSSLIGGKIPSDDFYSTY